MNSNGNPSLWQVYRWLWREAFVGQSPLDRFVARVLILTMHELLAVVVLCVIVKVLR